MALDRVLVERLGEPLPVADEDPISEVLTDAGPETPFGPASIVITSTGRMSASSLRTWPKRIPPTTLVAAPERSTPLACCVARAWMRPVARKNAIWS